MAKKTSTNRIAELGRQLVGQRRWIEVCGGDVNGYITRYGDSDTRADIPVSDGGRYGLGGQLIHAADMAALHVLEDELARLSWIG